MLPLIRCTDNMFRHQMRTFHMGTSILIQFQKKQKENLGATFLNADKFSLQFFKNKI